MNDIELIPLGKLRLSEANVRKNDSNLFIEELAANIEAKGLLQNLIVVPAKKRGMYDVTAGGRRLRALNYLLGTGKLPKDHPVACRVLDISYHTLQAYLRYGGDAPAAPLPPPGPLSPEP